MIKKIIARVKWWRLKRRLFKMVKYENGDVVTYKGVKYYVKKYIKYVEILSTPVPDITK